MLMSLFVTSLVLNIRKTTSGNILLHGHSGSSNAHVPRLPAPPNFVPSTRLDTYATNFLEIGGTQGDVQSGYVPANSEDEIPMHQISRK